MRKSSQALTSPKTFIPITVVVLGRRIHLRLHFDEDGGFGVDSSNMKGLVTQGETTEEAIRNGVDAAQTLMEGETLLRKRSAS